MRAGSSLAARAAGITPAITAAANTTSAGSTNESAVTQGRMAKPSNSKMGCAVKMRTRTYPSHRSTY